MPKATKKQRLKEDEEDNALMVAARQGVYIHVWDLIFWRHKKNVMNLVFHMISVVRECILMEDHIMTKRLHCGMQWWRHAVMEAVESAFLKSVG
jgi:hypothetical protein